MDEPTKPTDTSSEADKKLWENWERSNRLMMSFLKLSIEPNVKPSQPKTENAMLMQEEARQREELKVKLPQANFVYHGNSNVGSSGGKAPSKKWKNKGKQLFKVQPGKGQGESGKQSVIATSTMEVEFVACFEATVQSFWLCNFVDGLGIVGTIAKPLRIYCDNAAAVFFSKNDRYSKGVKHMDLKYLSVKKRGAKSKSSNSAHSHQ
ncbi:hypothetical protein V6N11_001526 [Hibiscus sabdariffa]|uniref:Uncharacterized protein n=1 Tax=Hibiscus sabdariffa TaxID=183260 RepID=A0ABR2RZW5_9ROSI